MSEGLALYIAGVLFTLKITIGVACLMLIILTGLEWIGLEPDKDKMNKLIKFTIILTIVFILLPDPLTIHNVFIETYQNNQQAESTMGANNVR